MKNVLHAFVLVGVIMSLLLAPLTVMGLPSTVDNTVDTESLETPVVYEDEPEKQEKPIVATKKTLPSKNSLKGQLRKAWKTMPKSYEAVQQLQQGTETFNAIMFTKNKKDALMLTVTVNGDVKHFSGSHYQKNAKGKFVDTGNLAYGSWTKDTFSGYNAGQPFFGFHEDKSNKWFVTTPKGEKTYGTYVIV